MRSVGEIGAERSRASAWMDVFYDLLPLAGVVVLVATFVVAVLVSVGWA